MDGVVQTTPASPEQKAEWLKKHGVQAGEDGVFTALPEAKAAAEYDTIVQNVRENAKRAQIPNLPPREYTDKIMVYCGGGPTLKYHLEEVRQKCLDPAYDVFTSNKTASYLLSNGITPNFHIIIDPKEGKIKDIEYDEDVELILGLQVHPKLFERAIEKGKRIRKFLAISGGNTGEDSDIEASREACHPSDPSLLALGGGSMTGTRMIFFAEGRGYRRLEYYGFDGHVELSDDGTLECYSYSKPRGENVLEATASNGRKFDTTLAFQKQAEELPEMLDLRPGIDVVIHGDSLLSNQLEIYKSLQVSIPERITPEYLALQRKMHEASGGEYGTRGHTEAPRVFNLVAQAAKKIGKCDVLDYGCGPGGLVKAITEKFVALPGVTYHEYDPCVPGKDAEPETADIVYCGDVMEHIEEQCVDAVVDHLADLTRYHLLLVVAYAPAKKTLPDGRNAHITIKRPDWWLSKFRRRFIALEHNIMDNFMIASFSKIRK